MQPLFPQHPARYHLRCVTHTLYAVASKYICICSGVGIIYLVLHVATHILTEKLQWKGFESGVYGNPPSLNFWFRQAAVYVFALTTMKLLVIALFAVLPIIFDLGEWLLTFLGPSNAAQVILCVSPCSVST